MESSDWLLERQRWLKALQSAAQIKCGRLTTLPCREQPTHPPFAALAFFFPDGGSFTTETSWNPFGIKRESLCPPLGERRIFLEILFQINVKRLLKDTGLLVLAAVVVDARLLLKPKPLSLPKSAAVELLYKTLGAPIKSGSGVGALSSTP